MFSTYFHFNLSLSSVFSVGVMREIDNLFLNDCVYISPVNPFAHLLVSRNLLTDHSRSGMVLNAKNNDTECAVAHVQLQNTRPQLRVF